MKRTYIGPYLDISVPVTEQKSSVLWCTKCDKPSVNHFYVFCPQCGTKLAKKQKPQRSPSKHHCNCKTENLFWVATDGDPFKDEVVSFIYTIGDADTLTGYSSPFWYNWTGHVTGAKDLSEMNVPEEIEWLEFEFKKDLKEIRRYYTADKIVIRWGLVEVLR